METYPFRGYVSFFSIFKVDKGETEMTFSRLIVVRNVDYVANDCVEVTAECIQHGNTETHQFKANGHVNCNQLTRNIGGTFRATFGVRQFADKSWNVELDSLVLVNTGHPKKTVEGTSKRKSVLGGLSAVLSAIEAGSVGRLSPTHTV